MSSTSSPATDVKTVTHPDGTKEWYLNGVLHREDGPAIVTPLGHKTWCLNGKIHREDGPAIEYTNGRKEWLLDGKFHRKDGPAVERPDGTKEWWLDGAQFSEDDFNKIPSGVVTRSHMRNLVGEAYRAAPRKRDFMEALRSVPGVEFASGYSSSYSCVDKKTTHYLEVPDDMDWWKTGFNGADRRVDITNDVVYVPGLSPVRNSPVPYFRKSDWPGVKELCDAVITAKAAKVAKPPPRTVVQKMAVRRAYVVMKTAKSMVQILTDSIHNDEDEIERIRNRIEKNRDRVEILVREPASIAPGDVAPWLDAASKDMVQHFPFTELLEFARDKGIDDVQLKDALVEAWNLHAAGEVMSE